MSDVLVLNARPSKPLVIAHRGARGHSPENTLVAASLGHTAGADLWELDVNYSSDFELVIIHDDTLPRTTDVEVKFPGRASYRVCDFTLAELRTLDAGSWYCSKDPFGRVAANEIPSKTLTSFANLAVPTLEEALLLTRELGWAVNVEIKNHAHLIGHDTVTKAVLDLVRKLGMDGKQVLLSSFQHQYLREARDLFPGLPTGALVEDVRPEDPVALCREIGAVAYHPDRRILAPGDLAELKKAGLAVNVWTVNDMDEAARLLHEGATGIITDFPAACRVLVDRK